MPEKRIFVPPSVFVQLVAAVAVAVVGLLATLAGSAALGWRVWGSALMLLASRASQVYFQVGRRGGAVASQRACSTGRPAPCTGRPPPATCQVRCQQHSTCLSPLGCRPCAPSPPPGRQRAQRD